MTLLKNYKTTGGDFFMNYNEEFKRKLITKLIDNAEIDFEQQKNYRMCTC